MNRRERGIELFSGSENYTLPWRCLKGLPPVWPSSSVQSRWHRVWELLRLGHFLSIPWLRRGNGPGLLLNGVGFSLPLKLIKLHSRRQYSSKWSERIMVLVINYVPDHQAWVASRGRLRRRHEDLVQPDFISHPHLPHKYHNKLPVRSGRWLPYLPSSSGQEGWCWNPFHQLAAWRAVLFSLLCPQCLASCLAQRKCMVIVCGLSGFST